MRSLSRLPIPKILEDKGADWTKIFVASGNPRPQSSQYAHKDIRDCLISISNHKCFYCEQLVKNHAKEVDHYIEVAEYKHLAFIWENLYLACENCNNKIPNRSIPVIETLDPCYHNENEIYDHLTFEDELINFIPGSLIGEQTIKKYKLDNPVLDHLRSIELKQFHKVFIAILQKCVNDGRSKLSDFERQQLLLFANNNRPFSLMFKILFRKTSF